MAYTTSIDLMRRRKRQLFTPPPSGSAVRSDYIGPDLMAALALLSSQERALIYGRIMEEMSFEDLSARHGASASTLRKRYERARKKLAGALRDHASAEKEALT